MASSILKNNFTGGIVGKRLWGQYNSGNYQYGCSKLENFRVLAQAESREDIHS